MYLLPKKKNEIHFKYKQKCYLKTTAMLNPQKALKIPGCKKLLWGNKSKTISHLLSFIIRHI